MGGAASKAKGGNFERECCRRLSRWVTRGARDDIFWRSATSGGRATFMERKHGRLSPAQAGDMTAIDPAGYELIAGTYFEFKHYADLQISSALIKQRGVLYDFWQRTLRDAKKYEKRPILVAKQNLVPTLALVGWGHEFFGSEIRPILTSYEMGADFYLFDAATEFKPAPRPRPYIRPRSGEEGAAS